LIPFYGHEIALLDYVFEDEYLEEDGTAEAA
jgi:hypothetical protein